MKVKFKVRSFEDVKNIIESYEDNNILIEFLNKFSSKKEISFEEYLEFNMKYVNGGCDEEYYIKSNWNEGIEN
jgi:SepF-like predicted cell division protein (DUF552 family)